MLLHCNKRIVEIFQTIAFQDLDFRFICDELWAHLEENWAKNILCVKQKWTHVFKWWEIIKGIIYMHIIHKIFDMERRASTHNEQEKKTLWDLTKFQVLSMLQQLIKPYLERTTHDMWPFPECYAYWARAFRIHCISKKSSRMYLNSGIARHLHALRIKFDRLRRFIEGLDFLQRLIPRLESRRLFEKVETLLLETRGISMYVRIAVHVSL